MFLHILQTELTSFILDYLSKDIYTVNSLRKICVSLRSEGQACLLPSIKTLGFLSSGFPSFKTAHGHPLGPICVALVGLEVEETNAKSAGTLATAIAVIICTSSLPWTLVFFHEHL